MRRATADRTAPFFALSGIRLRAPALLWLGLTWALTEGLLTLGRETGRFVFRQGVDLWGNHGAVFLALAMFFQTLLALALVPLLRRFLPSADDHLRWPPVNSCAGLATVLGIAMGLLMLVADHAPALLAGEVPDRSYSKSPVDEIGFPLVLLFTGLIEETLFRGVLVGALAVLIPGRIRVGAIDLPLAAYLVALLFGVAHWRSFLHDPLHLAIAQQLYAFLFALIYVWLMERSRSLLAPMVAHGVGNTVEVAAVVLLARAWG